MANLQNWIYVVIDHNDFERVNRPRVEKALKFVQQIQKSARSYRASDDELTQMLKPLCGALAIESPQTDTSESSGKSGGDTDGPTINHNWVRWALERLIMHDDEAAIEMLKKGLANEPS